MNLNHLFRLSDQYRYPIRVSTQVILSLTHQSQEINLMDQYEYLGSH